VETEDAHAAIPAKPSGLSDNMVRKGHHRATEDLPSWVRSRAALSDFHFVPIHALARHIADAFETVRGKDFVIIP
jgi:hypothetical protein